MGAVLNIPITRDRAAELLRESGFGEFVGMRAIGVSPLGQVEVVVGYMIVGTDGWITILANGSEWGRGPWIPVELF